MALENITHVGGEKITILEFELEKKVQENDFSKELIIEMNAKQTQLKGTIGFLEIDLKNALSEITNFEKKAEEREK